MRAVCIQKMSSTIYTAYFVLVVLFAFDPYSIIQIRASAESQIETYNLDSFPKWKDALHMPCEESNMFATKCMCHIKCTDRSCDNARKICEKYETNKGCKYMLIRMNGKLATLKRAPLPEESARFNIAMYPNSSTEIGPDSKWAHMAAENKKKNKRGPIIYQLLSDMNEKGADIIDKLFQPQLPSASNKYCGNKYMSKKSGNAASGIQSGSTRSDTPIIISNSSNAKEAFLSQSFALVALSYQAPKTLVNSMRTWKKTGLLDFMHETHAILNDPSPQEFAMAADHGFEIIQPKNIVGGKMSKPNVFTIGAAFYYALQAIESEYLIFLENDFKMDDALSRQDIKAELIAAAGMLDSGIEVVRLSSRKWKGCGTFKDCDHHGIHLDASDPKERLRNWYAFYCREQRKDAAGHVSDCFDKPDYRCFTSDDTNWTLNAVMVKKSTMLNKKYDAKGQMLSIGDIGLRQYQKQDGFETAMAWGLPWQQWRVPICIAYNGLFIHEEIETST